jgi:hypothetical protein
VGTNAIQHINDAVQHINERALGSRRQSTTSLANVSAVNPELTDDDPRHDCPAPAHPADGQLVPPPDRWCTGTHAAAGQIPDPNYER